MEYKEMNPNPRTLSADAVIGDIRGILSENPGLIDKVGIFGSLARGDFSEDSDIDLLVRYNEPPEFSVSDFIEYCGLCNAIQERLETLYSRNVDIAHFENDEIDNLDDPDVVNEVIWV